MHSLIAAYLYILAKYNYNVVLDITKWLIELLTLAATLPIYAFIWLLNIISTTKSST